MRAHEIISSSHTGLQIEDMAPGNHINLRRVIRGNVSALGSSIETPLTSSDGAWRNYSLKVGSIENGWLSEECSGVTCEVQKHWSWTSRTCGNCEFSSESEFESRGQRCVGNVCIIGGGN